MTKEATEALEASLEPVNVLVGGIDHQEISSLCTEIRTRFEKLAVEKGVRVRGGRSNNAPTLQDALHFLVIHAYYNDGVLDGYVESLVERASA